VKRILIIDDDQDILETTGALLEHEGFEVRSADTVEAGIGIIDGMFPEKKTLGFEAAAEIKARHPAIPLFVLTAINRDYAFDFTKQDVPCEEFINKPVRTDRLVELIRRYVGS
jgi:DNA-binding NtrC family response regulator